jgi:hypothetical protein
MLKKKGAPQDLSTAQKGFYNEQSGSYNAS